MWLYCCQCTTPSNGYFDSLLTVIYFLIRTIHSYLLTGYKKDLVLLPSMSRTMNFMWTKIGWEKSDFWENSVQIWKKYLGPGRFRAKEKNFPRKNSPKHSRPVKPFNGWPEQVNVPSHGWWILYQKQRFHNFIEQLTL